MDIIFLNGSSSSGKSSIAHELQNVLDRCYLHIGIDTFIGMMPSSLNRLSEGSGVSDGFYFEECIVNNEKAYRIKSGELGEVVNTGYRETVKILGSMGLGVIVDDVIDGGDEWQIWAPFLTGLCILKVGVYCDDEVLVRREVVRSDRRQGSAIEQANRVHNGMEYDLIVDTSYKSPLDCAQEIASFISNSRNK